VQSLQHGHERSGDDRARLSLGEASTNPPLYGICPDYFAPIVRETEEGDRRISFARWGLPSLRDALADKRNIGVTNIRLDGKSAGKAWFVSAKRPVAGVRSAWHGMR
jgi:putative SOS response-associated peptidase YedK